MRNLFLFSSRPKEGNRRFCGLERGSLKVQPENRCFRPRGVAAEEVPSPTRRVGPGGCEGTLVHRPRLSVGPRTLRTGPGVGPRTKGLAGAKDPTRGRRDD